MYPQKGPYLNRPGDLFDHNEWSGKCSTSTVVDRKGCPLPARSASPSGAFGTLLAVNPEADRLNNSLGAVSDSQLLVDACQVVLDRLLRYEQTIGKVLGAAYT